MSQVTGRVCDVCGDFATEVELWLKLSSHTESVNNAIDICSANCLLRNAQARLGLPEVDPTAKRPRRRFTDDEKISAVFTANQDGPAAAREFGVHIQTILTWRRQLQASAA